MSTTTSDRLVLARRHARMTTGQLAKTVGCSQSAISQLERNPGRTSRYFWDIANACGVRPEWLINGLGPMLPGAKDVDVTADVEMFRRASPEDKTVFFTYQSLTPEQKAVLRDLFRMVIMHPPAGASSPKRRASKK